MFDLLGWGECLLIFVVALIVVGPRDLPKVLYTLGRWFHSFKQTLESFKMELEGLSRLGNLQDLPGREKTEKKASSEKRPEISDSRGRGE